MARIPRDRPAARVGHGMAWSDADGAVVLYGGFAAEPFRDLWKWDGATWSQLAANGPTVTEGHVVTEAEHGVYIVGPGLGRETRARVWQWRAGAFQQVAEAGPPLLVGATATFDRGRGVLIYWGGRGETGEPSTVINEFDGTRWRVSRAP